MGWRGPPCLPAQALPLLNQRLRFPQCGGGAERGVLPALGPRRRGGCAGSRAEGGVPQPAARARPGTSCPSPFLLLPSALEAGLVGGRGTPLRAPPPLLSFANCCPLLPGMARGVTGLRPVQGCLGGETLGWGPWVRLEIILGGGMLWGWFGGGLGGWGLDRRIKLRKCALGVRGGWEGEEVSVGLWGGQGSSGGLREG